MTRLLSSLTALFAAGLVWADVPPKGKIAYARKSGEGYRIHVMNADGTEDREVPGQSAAFNVFPSWSPDGKRIAAMTADAEQPQSHQIVILNLDGKPAVTLQTPSMRSGLASWSPDGKRLMFTSGDRQPQVWIVGADGNGLRSLTPEGEGGFGGCWLNNQRVIHTRVTGNEEKATLVFRDVDSDKSEVFGPEGEGMRFAGPHSLSRDGNQLIYLQMERPNGKLSLRSWHLKDRIENTLFEYGEWQMRGITSFPIPSWTPDGKHVLAALPEDGGGTAVHLLDGSGMKVRRLTSAGVASVGAAWWPGE